MFDLNSSIIVYKIENLNNFLMFFFSEIIFITHTINISAWIFFWIIFIHTLYYYIIIYMFIFCSYKVCYFFNSFFIWNIFFYYFCLFSRTINYYNILTDLLYNLMIEILKYFLIVILLKLYHKILYSLFDQCTQITW